MLSRISLDFCSKELTFALCFTA